MENQIDLLRIIGLKEVELIIAKAEIEKLRQDLEKLRKDKE